MQRQSNALQKWNQEIKTILDQLEEKSLLRSLNSPDGKDFSSNDYLALNGSGLLTEKLKEIIADYQGFAGSGASRLVRGHDIFQRAEEEFAAYTGFPDCLLFNSGYGANVGVLSSLIAPNDIVFTDRLSHASLLDGIRLSGARRYYFAHNNLSDLTEKLTKYAISRKAASKVWIITESVFSMDGDIPDFPAMIDIARKYDALMIVDEAHSIGLFGPAGSGIISQHRLQNEMAVVIYPLGKAPGLMGGAVCCSADVKKYLVNRARTFVFSTAQPPLLAHLILDIIAILKSEKADQWRRHIQNLSQTLRNNLQQAGFDTGQSCSQIVPVIIGEEKKALHLAEAFSKAGLDIRPIRPPTVAPGTSRLRISIHADHTEQDIEKIMKVCKNQACNPFK